VILRFGGRPVVEVRDLPRLVAETPAGAEAETAIRRDGKPMTVRVRVGELRDERLAGARPQEPDSGGMRGK